MQKLNDQLPNLAIKTTNSSIKALQDYKGKHLVLYFYPKDDTPGCTIEANDFQKLSLDFAQSNALVVGVSKDSIASHQKFCDKFDLQFDLISDEQGELCEMFGVWVEKSMFGKKYMGIERATFLFNAQGELVQQWRKVKPAGHAAAVLKAVQKL